jgi:hypothetical protein
MELSFKVGLARREGTREFGRELETHELAADGCFRLHGWKLTWFYPPDKPHLIFQSGFNCGKKINDSSPRKSGRRFRRRFTFSRFDFYLPAVARGLVFNPVGAACRRGYRNSLARGAFVVKVTSLFFHQNGGFLF